MGPHSLSPPHRVSISFTLPSANWDGTINVRPHVAAIPMVVIDVELEGTHVGSVTLTPDTAHSLGLGLIDVVTRMQGQEGQREQHHGDPGRATDS